MGYPGRDSWDRWNAAQREHDAEVLGNHTRFLAKTILSGTGSPEGVLAASVGTLYIRSDGGAGTVLYIKESGAGNVGWVAK